MTNHKQPEKYYIKFCEGWYPIDLKYDKTGFIILNGIVPVTQEIIDDYIAMGVIAKLEDNRQFYGVMAQ